MCGLLPHGRREGRPGHGSFLMDEERGGLGMVCKILDIERGGLCVVCRFLDVERGGVSVNRSGLGGVCNLQRLWFCPWTESNSRTISEKR